MIARTFCSLGRGAVRSEFGSRYRPTLDFYGPSGIVAAQGRTA